MSVAPPAAFVAVESQQLTTMLRAADMSPGSFNADTREFDILWTTGATVRRSGWDGSYDEQLIVTPASVRIERMNSGGPVLLDHRADTGSQVGAIVPGTVRIGNDGSGHARVRLSRRPEVDGVLTDVQDGILRSVSVGYRIHAAQMVARDGTCDLMEVTDWEPLEVSLVPVPADAGAVVRSESGDSYPAQITRVVPANAEPEVASAADVIQEPEMPVIAPVDNSRAIADAVAAERTRATEIRSMATRSGHAEMADALIEHGATVDASRTALFEAMATRQAATVTHSPRASVTVVADETETRALALTNGLMRRAGLITDAEVTPQGREFANLSIVEMARDFVGRNSRGMSRDQVLEAAFAVRNTRSDTFQTMGSFPIALGNVMHRAALRGYGLMPRTFLPFVNIVEVPDFRINTAIQLGSVPGLVQVADGAVIPLGSVSDGTAEPYSVKTWSRRLAFGRQLLINDDMGATANTIAQYGARAAQTESDLVWNDAILSNPLMSDGVPLFATSRGNKMAAAPLSFESLSAARTALRTIKAPNGDTMNLVDKFLAVSPEEQTTAEKLIGAIAPVSSADVNPFASRLQLIVEPRLSGKGFLLIAEPALIDGIRVAYLQGARGLQSKTFDGREILGIEQAFWLDVGAAPVESRFAVLTPAA